MSEIRTNEVCKLLLSGDHLELINRTRVDLDWAVARLADMQGRDSDMDSLLLKAILQYTKDIERSPSIESLKKFIEVSRDPALQESWHSVIMEIDQLAEVELYVDDPEVLVNTFLDEVNVAFLVWGLKQSVKILNGQPTKYYGVKDPKGPDGALAYINSVFSRRRKKADTTTGMWHENTDAIRDSLFNKEPGGGLLKTGIKGMDNHWAIRRGKALVIAGASGDGKTTLLLTLLYNLAVKGQNILAISMEATQREMWEMLAFIHTDRFKGQFTLPSRHEWQIKKDEGTLSEEDHKNMDRVIASIQSRDKVLGLIDVKDFREWEQIKSYLNANHPKNDYSVLSVDYFGEKFSTPGVEPRNRNTVLNSIYSEAVNLAETFDGGRGLLLISPAQIKKPAKDAADAKFVDGEKIIDAPYDLGDIRTDAMPALINDSALVIGTWTNDCLRKTGEGIICCLKHRGTEKFPAFKFRMERNSKYIRDARVVQQEFEIKQGLNTLPDMKVL